MVVGHGSRIGRVVRTLVGVAACSFAGSVVAAETSKDAESPHRFYAGVTVGSLDFHDSYGGVRFHDTSVAPGIFGGAYLKDRLSLEISHDSTTAIDLHGLAGSGVAHFDVQSRRDTTALSVVREISLSDIFEWRRDWRVFGTAGIYRSNIDRSVTALETGQSSSARDRVSGALLGGGVLYRVGPVDLRGYFREFGVLGDKEGRDIGIVVQRKF